VLVSLARQNCWRGFGLVACLNAAKVKARRGGGLKLGLGLLRQKGCMQRASIDNSVLQQNYLHAQLLPTYTRTYRDRSIITPPPTGERGVEYCEYERVFCLF